MFYHLTRMLDLMAKTADPRNVTLQASKATKANLSYVEVIHWLLEIGLLPEHPDHSLNLESRHMISIIAESWIDYPPKSIKSIVDGLLTQKTSKQLVLSVLLYLVLELGVDLDEKRIDWFFKSQGLSSSIRDYINRIGRAGRIGHVGRATTFYDPDYDRSIAVELHNGGCT